MSEKDLNLSPEMQKLAVEFFKQEEESHRKILDQLDFGKDIDELKYKVNTLQTTQSGFKTIGIGVAAAMMGILGWFFVSVTDVKNAETYDRAIIEDVKSDLDAHKENPNIHTGGIDKLREHVRKGYVERETHDAVVEQLNDRIHTLEKLIQEILEGYIESANGKQTPNYSHDQ